MPGITNTKVIKFSTYTMQRFKQVQALLDRLDPEAEPQALVVPGSPTPEGGIIVFPGSFNPPTTAHLAMLKQARHFAYLHGHMKVYAADRKSTRLNSSHQIISYAVFCFQKKNQLWSLTTSHN